MMATLFLSVLTAGAATSEQETMVNLTLNDGLAGESACTTLKRNAWQF